VTDAADFTSIPTISPARVLKNKFDLQLVAIAVMKQHDPLFPSMPTA
jgi:hypothetical protein